MEKQETLQNILRAYVTEDPSRVLNATQLVRDITDRVPADEAQEFLMFQSAIRTVPVGSILFSAHTSSKVLRSAAKEKAVRQMTAGGIEQARATYAVDLLTEALGWNDEEKAPDRPAENVPVETQVESNPPASQHPVAEDATQVMPPVHDTVHKTPSEAPHPAWNQGPKNPAQEKRKKQTVLLAILAVLVVIGIGVGVYFHQMDSKFAAKCKEAETVTTDVRDFLAEIGELKGDPDGDDVKEYLDRLDKATSNLDQLASDLTAMKVSGKDEAKNKALIEAVLFEKGILDDTETVLKNPGDKRTGELTDKIRDDTKKLDDLAGNLAFETVDFPSAMQLDGLHEKLYGYVKKYRAIEAQKKSEEKRKLMQELQKQAAASPKLVTYHTNGKNTPMSVSATDITIHVGQKIHIAPDATCQGAGVLRTMGSSGSFNGIRIQAAGQTGGKGSATEFIITGESKGVSRFRLVPNYGDWDHAVDMMITVIE